MANSHFDGPKDLDDLKKGATVDGDCGSDPSVPPPWFDLKRFLTTQQFVKKHAFTMVLSKSRRQPTSAAAELVFGSVALFAHNWYGPGEAARRPHLHWSAPQDITAGADQFADRNF